MAGLICGLTRMQSLLLLESTIPSSAQRQSKVHESAFKVSQANNQVQPVASPLTEHTLVVLVPEPIKAVTGSFRRVSTYLRCGARAGRAHKLCGDAITVSSMLGGIETREEAATCAAASMYGHVNSGHSTGAKRAGCSSHVLTMRSYIMLFLCLFLLHRACRIGLRELCSQSDKLGVSDLRQAGRQPCCRILSVRRGCWSLYWSAAASCQGAVQGGHSIPSIWDPSEIEPCQLLLQLWHQET